jgi:uncharacterized protein (DUF2141 family)
MNFLMITLLSVTFSNQLEVVIKDIKNDKGDIRVGIFSDENNFW